MKEFEKKPNPNREPASEGMKGLSKFLPMSDSSYRRRLTEYEIQVQDLQAYVRSLEAETVHLRKKLEDAPKDSMVLENKLREANRQLVQAFNQNEKLVNALYEAREQITVAQGRGRQALRAAVDVRRVPVRQRGRHRQHPLAGPQGEGQPAPRAQGRGPQARPGARSSTRGSTSSRPPATRSRARSSSSRSSSTTARAVVTLRADEDKVGIIADPLRDASAEDRRSPPDGRQERLPAREAAQERGRGPHARGSARTSATRTSAASAPRSRRSRTPSSCRTSTPTTTRSTSSPRPRACCSTALPAAARP